MTCGVTVFLPISNAIIERYNRINLSKIIANINRIHGNGRTNCGCGILSLFSLSFVSSFIFTIKKGCKKIQ